MIEFGKAVIVPSYACNQRCVYCYAQPNVLRNHRTMSLAEVKVTIDFFSELQIKTITILGGEPLLYPDLDKLIIYALEKNITSWIVTNGTELCKNNIGQKLVDLGLKGGCISVFSMDEQIHNSVTNKYGSFQMVLKSLRQIIQSHWPLFPMITIGDQPFENTYRDVKELVKLGFSTVYINYGVPNVFDSIQPQYVFQPQLLADYTYRLYAMQEEFNVRFVFNCEKNKVPICHFDSKMFSDLYAEHQIGYGCEMIQGNTVVVEPGGDVLGCSHWIGFPLLNIYKEFNSLTLISKEEFYRKWERGYPAKVREMINKYPYEKCSSCELKEFGKCFGGCKTILSRNLDVKYKQYGKQ